MCRALPSGSGSSSRLLGCPGLWGAVDSTSPGVGWGGRERGRRSRSPVLDADWLLRVPDWAQTGLLDCWGVAKAPLSFRGQRVGVSLWLPSTCRDCRYSSVFSGAQRLASSGAGSSWWKVIQWATLDAPVATATAVVGGGRAWGVPGS